MNVYIRSNSPHRMNVGQPKPLVDGPVFSPTISRHADGIRIAIGAEGVALFIEMTGAEAAKFGRALQAELSRAEDRETVADERLDALMNLRLQIKSADTLAGHDWSRPVNDTLREILADALTLLIEQRKAV